MEQPANGAGIYWILGSLGFACLAVAGYLLWSDMRPSPNVRGFDLVPRPRVPAFGKGSGEPGPDVHGSLTETARGPGATDGSEAIPAIEALDPRAAARDLETRKAPAAPANVDPAAENKLFTLLLSGTLADQPLDAEDPQTWARLGYCLTEECPSRHWLVFPDGGVPLIQPPKSLLKSSAGKPSASRAAPQGDRSRPTYRLVLQAEARAAGTIAFYGRELASKYECRLTCTIEKRLAGGDGFVRLHVVTAEERISPAKDAKDSPAALIRLCYDAALDRLAANLKGHAFFAGTTSPVSGVRKDPAKAAKKK